MKESRFEAAFGKWVVKYRWWLIIATILAVFAAASGTHRLTSNNDTRVFFSEENPQLQALEALENTYNKVSVVLFGIAPQDGSVFTREVEKYTYKWVRDETLNDQECFVVEFYPVDKKNSGYTRQVTWIDKTEYRVWKVEYYDRKNSHLKTLTIEGYQKYLDKYWRADEMNMVNHQNGKSTGLQFSDYKFGVGLKDRDFNKNALKRAR